MDKFKCVVRVYSESYLQGDVLCHTKKVRTLKRRSSGYGTQFIEGAAKEDASVVAESDLKLNELQDGIYEIEMFQCDDDGYTLYPNRLSS